MRRFGGLVLLLIACYSLAILAALGLAHFKSPSTLATALFSEPGGSPCQSLCVFGVQPDQSDMFAALQAIPQLEQLDFYTPNSPGDVVQGYQANAMRIQASQDRQWIEVQFEQNFPSAPPSTRPLPPTLRGQVSLADVISIYGPPDYAFANNFLTAHNGRSYSQWGCCSFFSAGATWQWQLCYPREKNST